jgi:simple sugar transport system substrate-binding protein
MNRLLKMSFFVCVLLLFTVVPALGQDEFVFGVVLVGPRNDGGWSQAHVEGGEYIEANVDNARMIVFESLNPADSPEATLESVVRDMVDQGARLILTTSDAFEEDTAPVAEMFPDVVFINISGDDVALGDTPPNMGNFTGQLVVPRMIAGCAAALATQTGSIGLVGPLINDETRRDQNSAYLGARYCWENYRDGSPDELSFSVTWIGFWFNIPGVTLDPSAETDAFLDGGSDVIIAGIDTREPLVQTQQRALQGNDVWMVGTDSRTLCEDAEPQGVCLGTQFYNWGPSYLETAEAVIAGTWEPSFEWFGPDWSDLNNPDTSHVGFTVGAGLSEENQANLAEFVAELAAFATDPANEGCLPLWVGPLNYQDGTELAAEGECLPAFQLESEGPSVWYMKQLLEGMNGASE